MNQHTQAHCTFCSFLGYQPSLQSQTNQYAIAHLHKETIFYSQIHSAVNF